MRVVLAHKFYHMTGGTEQYFRHLTSILEGHGHRVIPFALQHPENPPTPYEKYFLDNLDYRQASLRYYLRRVPRILGRTLYSWEARRKMAALIDDLSPDIAHLQSIEHHISPSILHTLRRHGVPCVQSVNTYKLICASYRLYLLDRQEICERCLYGKHYHAVLTRCVKGSLPASLLATVEMYLHGLLKIYHLVDRFIVPNRFMAQKLAGAGFPETKIVRMLNPLDLDEHPPHIDFDDFILYFGRLDPEKGVFTLVQAMAHLPDLRLVVVGDGAQEAFLRTWCADHGVDNVDFVGPQWGDDLAPYLTRARLVVVPSIWYEPSPMVIYQSLATGKPVVGADIGGIPDLLTEETGALFQPGDVADLARVLSELAFDTPRLRAMGRAARRWAEAHLDPERYYRALMALYDQVIAEKAF
jgi:glycosyltransferase involved in cell wall biosynthesis